MDLKKNKTNKFILAIAILLPLLSIFATSTNAKKSIFHSQIVFADSKKLSSNYKDNISSLYKGLDSKNKNKVDKILKKKKLDVDDLSKNSSNKDWQQFSNALDMVLKPERNSKNNSAKALYSAHKKSKVDIYVDDDSSSGSSSSKKSSDDGDSEELKEAKKAIKEGKLTKPDTLRGKIGQAFLNFVWSSPIGQWITKNGAGGTIFGGVSVGSTSSQKAVSNLESIVKDHPYYLIYPVNTVSDRMSAVSNWIEPAIMALAIVFLVVSLIVTGTMMGTNIIFRDPARARLTFFHNLGDTIISVIGLLLYANLINTLLQFNGEILLALAKVMVNIKVSGTDVFKVAMTLGADNTVVKALGSGALLGSEYGGVLFIIIYLLTMVFLAVYLKYYYFMRAVVFTILVSLGPIFIAFWSLDWGKSRAVNWLREMVSTIFIQSIHALDILFLAMFMAWNNNRIALVSAKTLAKTIKWQNNHPWKNAISGVAHAINLPFVGSWTDSLVGKPSTVGASNFEVLVIGFIIMISFQPIARGLAELFGVQTRMLDNLHQSTSNTLKTAAMLGGGALLAASPAGGAIALGKTGLAVGKGLGQAGKIGLKSLLKSPAKGARSRLANAWKAAKGVHKPGDVRRRLGKDLSRMREAATDPQSLNGLFATAAGTPIGMNPWAVQSLISGRDGKGGIGGIVGKRARNLSTRSLARLGLSPDDQPIVNKRNQLAEENKEAARKDVASKMDALSDPQKLEEFTSKMSDADRAKVQKDVATWNKVKNNPEQRKAFLDGRLDSRTNSTGSGYVKASTSQDKLKSTISDLDGTEYDKQHMQSDQVEDGYSQRKAAAMSEKSGIDVSSALRSFNDDYAKNHNNQLPNEQRQNDFLNSLSGSVKNASYAAYAQGGAVSPDAVVPLDSDTVNSVAQKMIDEHFAGQQGVDEAEKKNYLEKVAMPAALSQSRPQVIKRQGKWTDGEENSLSNSWVDTSHLQSDFQNQIESDSNLKYLDPSDQNKIANKLHFNDDEMQHVMKDVYYPTGGIISRGIGNISRWAGRPNNRFNDRVSIVDSNLYHQLAQQSTDSQKQWDSSGSAQDYIGNYENLNTVGNQVFDTNANEPLTDDGVRSYFDRMNKSLRSTALDTRQAELNAEGANYDYTHRFDTPVPNEVYQNEANKINQKNQRLMDEARIGGYSIPQADHFGINPSQAWKLSGAESISKQQADSFSNTPGLLPEGTIRLITTNGNSYIDLLGTDGMHHMVGSFGQGDSSLGQGETAFTDLDFDNNKNIVPSLDPLTHRPASSYIMRDNQKVPYEFRSGFPDLTQMTQSLDDSVTRANDFYAKSRYHNFDVAPSVVDSISKNYEAYPTYENLAQDYDDFRLNLDKDNAVITATRKNDKNGDRFVVSQIGDNDFINKIPNNVETTIPLKNYAGSWYFDTTSSPSVHLFGPATVNARDDLLEQAHTLLDNQSRQSEYSTRLNDLMRSTPRSKINYRNNNHAPLSISAITTFSQRVGKWSGKVFRFNKDRDKDD